MLEEAIDAGIVAEEDAEPENLAELHQAHAAELLGCLSSIDATYDARRRGIDPATGRLPRSHAKRVKLPELLRKEIARLERWWQTLLDTYEAAFGAVAADAFAKAVRAHHAGIDVVAGTAPVPDRPAHASLATPELPSPRPIAESVAAGTFGRDEAGVVVAPCAEEVDVITRQHAELLIDLLEALRGNERAGSMSTQQDLTAKVQEAVQKYAVDFGPEAAAQLLAYARRQASLNDPTTRGSGIRSR